MKWKYRFGIAIGNALEYYGIAVFAAISVYLSAELEKLGYSQSTILVWGIFALRFLIRPIGGVVIGRYADIAGKKAALVLTSFITGVATLCMALLPIQLLGIYTPIAILILQLALAFSFGGEYPSVVTYLFSDTKNNERARIAALISGSVVAGVILSVGLVVLLQQFLDKETMYSIGWRIPLLVGLLNIGISFWFRARLPEKPENKAEKRAFNWQGIVYLFLLTAPASVAFYSQNLSGTIIVKHLKYEVLKDIFPLISSGLLLVLIILTCWFTTKCSTPSKIYRMGVAALVLLSVPVYFTLQLDSLMLVGVAQLVIAGCSAMIIANLPAVLASAVHGNTAMLGAGYNGASVCIGGITPLAITYLSDFHLGYAGCFIAFCGALFFLIRWLPKSQELGCN
ncbi:MFS transporter [Providencia zhijiangensis]|uniref:MFS transporter n=1 Tax=Providencia zhijiangensis TaxID=3053982 RepID=A0ABZ0N052_9GAMM|nr:MFS transporter [Providencia sp. D4759]WPA91752.1 MFS transporter [Providencia sp. D4759]